MNQFYSNRSKARWTCTLLLFVFLSGAFAASHAQVQVYTASLSGPAEAPPNNSPGTGHTTITISGTSMRVQATFSGLLSPVTISHIHAPTLLPMTGTAGVATPLPSFPNFPAGGTSGTYDMTFDMTLPGSYSAPFLAANGGNPLTAFQSLKNALNNATAYLNIHTVMFPGGEIRGFPTLCPTINVSIPAAFALPQGTLPNTVYPAYSPASSLMLTANVSGGTGPYTYNWSNGSTAATTTVSPTSTTQYTVTVLDQNRCPGTASRTVNVMDIASGKKGDKIDICHKGKNVLSIASPAVDDHLRHGDMLGGCNEAAPALSLRKAGSSSVNLGELSIRALPNPSRTYFDLHITGEADNPVRIRVFDLMGRNMETKTSVKANGMLRLGAFYNPGIYLVEISQGNVKQTLKLIKE